MTDPLTILYESLSDNPEQNPVTNMQGDKVWLNKIGLPHREDGPAIIRKGGTKEWKIDGRFHREDGPAIERPDGTKEWFKHNDRHREDGPAVESANGSSEYWLEDRIMSKGKWLQDPSVQRVLALKKLENKDIKDDDFLRTFGGVL